jgi:hypothetical protein
VPLPIAAIRIVETSALVGQDCILRAGFQPALVGLFTSDSGGLPTRRRLQTCPTVLVGFQVLGKVCGIVL